MALILIVLSILPIFLIGWYIYSKDKNKEPIKLLIKLFLYGVIACFLTLFITFVLSIFFPLLLEEVNNLNYIQLFFKVFFGIALIEEFSKWIMVYLISYKNKYFDEVYDMIVYSTFVTLGFATFENLLYVFEGGVVTGIIRALTAIPGHTCFGVMMGYYLSKSKMDLLKGNKSSYKKNLILSILVPTIIHGIYDYVLFSYNSYLLIFFIVFLIFIYILSINKIKSFSKTINIFYKNNFCSNCGFSIKEEYNFCINCGNKIKDKED